MPNDLLESLPVAPPKPSLEEIENELSAIDKILARRAFINFIKYTKPDYEVSWHHRLVAAKLDDVLNGKTRRLMIFEPPQNGKSEQVSRRFPAYVFGRKPKTRIVACSYNDSLAQDMSRDVQKIMVSRQYRELFPDSRLAESSDIEKRTQGQFDVVGHSGYYVGAGINGSITGKTADIGLIDDPIKNRAEAESATYRDRVWEQYKSAFATRQFGDAGAIVLCQTRWHEDDLAGRLLSLAADNAEADQWEVLLLPAIQETIHVRTGEGDPIPVVRPYDTRAIGEPLWPEKYPLPELTRRRAGMGEYDWAALYQQQPAPSGGGLFKEEWFAGKFVDAAPVIARRARGWDTAGTEDGGDRTAGVKIAEPVKQADVEVNGKIFKKNVPAGVYYIEDIVVKQVGPHGVETTMKLTAELDGLGCVQREEQEPGSSGGAVIETRLKTLAGRDYAGVRKTGNKITWSKGFRAQCEGGNVYIVRDQGKGGLKGTGWNRDFIAELCSFPTGEHDDMVDAASTAFNSVLLEPVPEGEWITW